MSQTSTKKYLHHEVDAGPNDVIEVTLDHAANVQLIDPGNYDNDTLVSCLNLDYGVGRCESRCDLAPPPRQTLYLGSAYSSKNRSSHCRNSCCVALCSGASKRF
jgi:hypothetical protein